MVDEKSPFDFWNPPHLKRIAIPMLVYLGLGILAATQPPASGVRLAGVLGMVAAFVWIVVADLMAIRRLDELGQRIHGEAALLALLVIVGLWAAYALIRQADLPMPRIRWIWLPPLILSTWGLCIGWVRQRYR